MTQQEFESRTGISVSAEEFTRIHDIYMAAGDNVSKDTFCSQWKKHHDCTLIAEMAARIIDLESLLEQADNTIKSLGEFLAEVAYETGRDDARKKSIHTLGEKRYLRLVIDEGYDLTHADRILLKSYLQ